MASRRGVPGGHRVLGYPQLNAHCLLQIGELALQLLLGVARQVDELVVDDRGSGLSALALPRPLEPLVLEVPPVVATGATTSTAAESGRSSAVRRAAAVIGDAAGRLLHPGRQVGRSIARKSRVPRKAPPGTPRRRRAAARPSAAGSPAGTVAAPPAMSSLTPRTPRRRCLAPRPRHRGRTARRRSRPGEPTGPGGGGVGKGEF